MKATICNESESFSLINKLTQKSVIITDHTVQNLYGHRLHHDIISFPPGEASKTRTTKELVEDELFSRGYSKDTLIIALGGGVVTDLAGFVASTFCRGVPFISVPTTLMAMVDAAHGGKTGVNTPHGKNLIGTYYDPEEIFVDPIFLKTLPQSHILQGRVEMLKIGAVYDRKLFFDPTLEGCIALKEHIVSLDKKTGIRDLLNFGHTIGHALEASANYTLSHGEAVAIGMRVEAKVAHLLGHLSLSELALLESALPYTVPPFGDIEPYLRLDKKGPSCYVLLIAVGEALAKNGRFSHHVPFEVVKEALC